MAKNCLHHLFPHLITFAKKTSDTVQEVLSQAALEDLFHLPLSQQAYDEFLSLQDLCLNARQRIQEGEKDQWSYIWGSASFSTSKAYKVMIGSQPVLPHFSLIWNSSCQAKHKVFFWLLLHDRLNTRNLLRRKTFHLPSYNCATLQCNQEETLMHLFWSCPFAERC